MKLASLRDGTRDGRLLVVRPDGQAATLAPPPWPTMQAALDDWERARPALAAVAHELAGGGLEGFPIDPTRLPRRCRAPTSGSTARAFLNHVILVRKARGAEPPKTLETDPLVYQGGSSDLLGPRDRSSSTIRPGASTTSPRSA
jgi:fumarylacetoacetate (FAA) hydrolase